MSRFDKKAVALKYNAEQDLAPVVIASGYGEVAENIIDIAEQRGIPVYRDDSAASMLCMLEIGTTIPREMYELVAAIYLQILKTASQLQGAPSPVPARHETAPRAGHRAVFQPTGRVLFLRRARRLSQLYAEFADAEYSARVRPS